MQHAAHILRGHGSLVSALTFNRDGTRLASAALDGWIKIWHPMLGEELFSLQDDAAIISIDFSPDGQRLATGGINQSAKIWDASPP